MKRLLAGTLAAALAFGLAGCVSDEECAEKPVIYYIPNRRQQFLYRWTTRHADRDLSGV